MEKKEKSILDYETVSLDLEHHALVIIDQTQLPGKIEMLSLTDIKDIWEAIRLLKVRGAPAIGVAAAAGIYLAAEKIDTEDTQVFYSEFQQAKKYLATSRPTAVNLFWALDRMENVVRTHLTESVAKIQSLLQKEAVRIHDEDMEVCRKIGEYALELVKPGDGLLTHCNAGQLATVKYGTATAPMYLGKERGDVSNTSFHSQISCVLKVEGKKDLYIACADRWVTDRMDLEYETYKKYYEFAFSPDEKEREKVKTLNLDMAVIDDHRRNTSISDYVWLPICFEGGMIYIDWLDEWRIEDYE